MALSRPILLEREDALAEATPALHVQLVSTEDALLALRDDWGRLVEAMSLPSPFQSWDWNRTWWRYFGSGRRLQLLVFRDGSQVVGIAQLFERRYLGSMRLLAPLGWGDGHDQRLTEQLEFIFPAGDPRPWRALAAWLGEQRRCLVWLPGLTGAEAWPPSIQARLVMATRERYHHRGLPQTWEQLATHLNKSMRDNVRYYPRLMLRHGHPFAFDVASSPEHVSASLPTLFRFHRLRANIQLEVQHADHFCAPSRRAFMLEAAPLLASLGQLRIGVLRVAGRPIAAQMWLEKAHTMFLYYSGYEPSWSRYSVALIATVEAIKDGISRGIDRLEFLLGGGQSKRRWDTEQRFRQPALLVPHPAMVPVLSRFRRLRRELSTSPLMKGRQD